jgi:RNA polymerase sigma factor (sigma-70 family)
VRRYGHFDTAEDATQEALIAAATTWPKEGRPDHPLGWLITVASRRLTDLLRSEQARARRQDSAAQLVLPAERLAPAADQRPLDADDTLILLFMCCHPSLSPASQIALTLRAVGGLTTLEIARAFLVPEATMTRRITRAKQTIKDSGVPFRLPEPPERTARLGAVLHVLYLIFNEGYVTTSGANLYRTDLSFQAIRLCRGVHHLLPHDPEVTGLLALMLLTNARRAARTGAREELIPLDKQDRSLWDRAEITEGTDLLTFALSKGTVGLYQLQAAIAAVHDEAAREEDTDWPQILALYELLKRVAPSPIVTLNHAVAVAMVHGPERGLECLRLLDSDERVAGHYRLDAVRGHLYEKLGDFERAMQHYRTAAAKTTSIPEQNYLMTQVARLGEAGKQPNNGSPGPESQF